MQYNNNMPFSQQTDKFKMFVVKRNKGKCSISNKKDKNILKGWELYENRKR